MFRSEEQLGYYISEELFVKHVRRVGLGNRLLLDYEGRCPTERAGRKVEYDSRVDKQVLFDSWSQPPIYASSMRRGSSMYSLTFTRNVTASLPSSMR